MKRLRPLLSILIFAVLAAGASAEDETAPPPPSTNKRVKKGAGPEEGGPEHPGLFNRVFHTLHLSKDKKSEAKKAPEAKSPTWKHLTLSMKIDPLPVKLSEAHQMRVIMKLENRSKTAVQLEFPTTQRIEVVVKNQEGKLVEHWSEDQSFSNEPGVVAINPGERVEYTASVATRDLTVGGHFSVEGFFPNYEALHAVTTIIPEK